jgi:DNA-binding NarL/FixJ family response regulator
MARNGAQTASLAVSVVSVDDQALFREVLREVVKAMAGFTLVAEAACGEDAITLAERLHPDLMIVDVRMPDVSGLEVSARLASLRPRPVVVLVSGSDHRGLPELAVAHGALGFLAKHAIRPRTLRALWERRDGGQASDAEQQPDSTAPTPAPR